MMISRARRCLPVLGVVLFAAAITVPSVPAEARTRKLRLRPIEVRDVNMNMVAYTQLVPRGWKLEGRVEWKGYPAHPQRMFTIESPRGVSIDYLPAMHFEFIQLHPQFQGSGIRLPQQNIPPPRDVGSWLGHTFSRMDPSVNNVRVLNDVRDRAVEQRLRQASPQFPTAYHHVQFAFTKNGRPMISEASFGYVVRENRAFNAGYAATWSIYFDMIITYPKGTRKKYEPIIATVVASQKASPRWMYARNQTLAQLSRQRQANHMAILRRNAENARRMSDNQMASWRKQQAASDSSMASWRRRQASDDRIQRKLVNSIGDVEDYRLPEGGTVNLSNQYKHVYRTPRGNYLLSDTRVEDVNLTKLRPVR